ncbi:hypothetical protein F0919_03860 [Taibaiella lutea]|uniref:Rubredoxin-like domain-containing protein n=1 Tax=Taibaiella lutea TaxID=2608001 RepID=A0A5M6CP73_9BACT|nr:hypothetical protein [Taibaiella lutea]KAA5536816.1 hypothetical protein F0919_03860 [Taibaiella lutea]
MEHHCRVCGLYIEDAPWGEDGKSPTYEICPCCGVEFGNEDYILESVRSYRKKWLDNGTNWFINKAKPLNWTPEEQLTLIPEDWY